MNHTVFISEPVQNGSYGLPSLLLSPEIKGGCGY